MKKIDKKFYPGILSKKFPENKKKNLCFRGQNEALLKRCDIHIEYVYSLARMLPIRVAPPTYLHLPVLQKTLLSTVDTRGSRVLLSTLLSTYGGA